MDGKFWAEIVCPSRGRNGDCAKGSEPARQMARPAAFVGSAKPGGRYECGSVSQQCLQEHHYLGAGLGATDKRASVDCCNQALYR